MLIQFFSFDIAFANTFFTAIGSTVNFASRLEDTYSINYTFFVFAIGGDNNTSYYFISCFRKVSTIKLTSSSDFAILPILTQSLIFADFIIFQTV